MKDVKIIVRCDMHEIYEHVKELAEPLDIECFRLDFLGLIINYLDRFCYIKHHQQDLVYKGREFIKTHSSALSEINGYLDIHLEVLHTLFSTKHYYPFSPVRFELHSSHYLDIIGKFSP